MIIDTHTHFYDPFRKQGIPWPDPQDEVLYRRVLPEDYKALAVPEGVTGTVVVEASVWVEDNAWILDLAARETFIVGFVGNLQPGGEGFVENLNRFAANPLFRGIRPRGLVNQMPGWEAAVADLEKLVAKDLELDVLVRADGLPGVAALAARLPELRIVIDHVAMVPIDGAAPDATWAEGMRQAADHSNVYCKVSGLVEVTQAKPPPSDAAYYAPTLDCLWNGFGAERLIYGSNWPVSGRFADYAAQQRIVKAYFEAKGSVAAENYFWRNAKAVYKWLDRR